MGSFYTGVREFMLIVLVQARGGEDLLREATRSGGGGKGLYAEGMPSEHVLELAQPAGFLRVVFPERGLHPEDQVVAARRLVELSRTCTVYLATHSLMVIYAVNNSIMKDETLQVEAYCVTKTGRESIFADRWIDEGSLGSVADDLAMELNQIHCQKYNPTRAM